MRRAIERIAAGQWPETESTGSITLAYGDRHRRRVVLDADDGKPFLLDLPHACLLADGDGLALEDGGFIAVKAAEEPVIEVNGHSHEHLARLAWHIGNRHAPVQVLADGRLRILADHVLEEMLKGLGAHPLRRMACFQPESGAYGGDREAHGHEHGHGHPHHHGS